MSEPKAQQSIAQELLESKAKLKEIEQLKQEIRRSRLALINSLKDTPEGGRQRTRSYEVEQVEEENRQIGKLPLRTEEEQKRVLFETEHREELSRNVRISGRREIEEVFYGDSYHPRSISPQQRLSRNDSEVRVPKKDMSHSTIIARVNRNSLTPTKITFSYQNNPSNSVAYTKNSHIIQTQRENSHLKESVVKEVIVRHPSPPAIIRHQQINHYIPPPMLHHTPIQVIHQKSAVVCHRRPEVHEIREFGDSRRRVVTVSSDSVQKYRPANCKIQQSGKRCKLCELTRSHLKGVRQMKFTSVIQAAPKEIIVAQEQPAIIQNQCQDIQINNSPGKARQRPYLSTEDKHSLRRTLFLGQDDQKIKKQRLNHDFLNSMGSRNKIIETELDRLNQPYPHTPVKVPKVDQQPESYRNSGRTRKKIFENNNLSKSNPFIRIEDGHLPYSTSKSVCYVRALPRERTYSQIHGFSPEFQQPLPLLTERKVILNPGYRSTIMVPTPVYHQRVVTRSPGFAGQIVTASPPHHLAAPSFTRTLTPVKNERILTNAPIVVERIVAPSQQEKVLETREVVNSRLDYGLLRDRNNFIKKDVSITTSKIQQSKLVRIPEFGQIEMSAEVRSWYEVHKKEIEYQAERICSYDLIRRYMSEREIRTRLHKLMAQKVEPKRWLLLMVDEVYGKLKDRYVPMSS